MHQTVDYSQLEGQEKIDAAVKDVKEWLTDKQWESVQMMLEHPGYDYEFFSGCMSSLAGVNGYPIQALWQSAGRELPSIQ